jgi:hypothetical protein
MQADIVFEEICWIEERCWEGSWWSSTPLSVPDLYVMLLGQCGLAVVTEAA